MNIKTVNLETVCGITSKLPVNSLAEFAFAGKSNVGKSSLINCLINRKSYARTSAEPGKTQTINYYRVTYMDGETYFVDLPGYGYARVSPEAKQKWGKMIERYLHTSKQLKCVFLLVDIRHTPSANDIQMIEWIRSSGFVPAVIATKLDKIKRSQYSARIKDVKEALNLTAEEVLIPFSSQTKQGREEVWNYIVSKNSIQNEE